MKTIKCPCCQKRKDKSDLTRLATLLPFDGFMLFTREYLDSFLAVAGQYSLYQWACDTCLESKRGANQIVA